MPHDRPPHDPVGRTGLESVTLGLKATEDRMTT